jgi:hypothetical protein
MEELPLDLPAFLESCTRNVLGSDIQHHLRSEAIPAAHSDTQAAVELIEHAIGSLRMLQSMMIESSFCKGQLNGLDVGPLVHAAWPDIWRWIVFLHTRCITNQVYGGKIMRASLHTIPYTLRSFGWYADLRLSVIRTPGLISMLTQYWLKEDEYVKQPELAWDHRYFALSLEGLLTYGTDNQHHTDEEVVTCIVHTVDGGAATVVRVALQQFGTLSLEILDFEVVSFLLTLNHQVLLSHPTLRMSLLHQGIISSITRFLQSLPPLSRDQIPPALDRAVMMAGVHLIQFTHTIIGPPFIVKALNEGLLTAFVISWPWIQRIHTEIKSDASSWSAHFFTVLEDYLVYRSVLRSLGKALKSVDCMHILVPACEPWVAFHKAASERLCLKDEFDNQSGSRLDPGFCGCAHHDVR